MTNRFNIYFLALSVLLGTALYSCTPVQEENPEDNTQQEEQPPVIQGNGGTGIYAKGDGPQEQSKLWLPKNPGELPIIYIECKEEMQRYSFVPATYTIVDRDGKYSTPDSVIISGQIRKRGNSTLLLSDSKYPLRIKFDSGYKLLGMDKNKDWNLMANFTDKTLLRNVFAWKLSRFLAMPWTPKYRHVEVYFNGEHHGLYTLTQTNEVANHRAELHTPEDGYNGHPEEYDYYFELDNTVGDSPTQTHFTTSLYKIPVTMKEPQVLNSAQKAYVKKQFSQFEDALKNKMLDPENGPHKYMDMHSFVAYYLINELSKNMDGNLCRSTFMSLRSDGKFYFQNLWDFDLAFGNADNFEVWNFPSGPQGFFINRYNWFKVLYDKDTAFRDELARQWALVYPNLEDIIAEVQEEADDFAPARERNFKTYDILPIYVWSNLYWGGSYQDYLDFMFNYTRERAEWLNNYFPYSL